MIAAIPKSGKFMVDLTSIKCNSKIRLMPKSAANDKALGRSIRRKSILRSFFCILQA